MRLEGVGNGPLSTGWELYDQYRRSFQQNQNASMNGSLAAGQTQESPQTKQVNKTQECETCEERRYQDGSDDPGVSFKTPTNLSPQQASSAVRGHEMQHVGRERSKAQRENREVVSQTVTYHNAICPECGRTYVSGGTTRTTTRAEQEKPPFEEGKFEAYA